MSNRRKSMLGAVAVGALAGGVAAPTAVRAEPQGHVPAETGVGYFYGTFGQDPNLVLLVGGTAEDFCLDAPDDPFGSGEPGTAPMRMFFRASGAVDMKVNDKGQPIHLYEAAGESPEFITSACAAFFDGDPSTSVPTPVASGTADLKVRLSVISDDLVDVFNSVNGTAAADDGTEYKVRASADLVVENGVPVGDPADFVSLDVSEIRRGG